LNSEKDIKKEAKRLAKENDWDKLHALLYLSTKFESEYVVPKRQPLLLNSYLSKKLMKSENMMVFNQ
jgi:hypothetical protein